MENYVADFKADADIIIKADGYYFTARYPGVDAYNVDKRDVEQCWKAVEHTRESVIAYMKKVYRNQDSRLEKGDDIDKFSLRYLKK